MVRERNVIEDDAIVVLVVRAPPAVGPLHGDDPRRAPSDGILQVSRSGHLHFRQRHQHHGRIIHIGIEFVFILEIPAAWFRLRRRHLPITDCFRLP